MFAEPTINAVSNLFSAPGLQLEVAGASVLAIGVVCYLARIAWFSLALARRIETDEMRAVAPSTPHDAVHPIPYCAG